MMKTKTLTVRGAGGEYICTNAALAKAIEAAGPGVERLCVGEGRNSSTLIASNF